MIDLAAGLDQGADDRLCDALPWECSPYRLWSLWEMLDKYAWFFFVFAHLLETLNRELGLPSPAFASGIGNSLAGLNALGGGIATPLRLPLPQPPQSDDINDDQRFRLIAILNLIDEISKKIDVTISNDIKRVSDYVKLP